MIYISEICSSTLIHFLSWLFRVGGGDVFRPSTVIPTHSLRCFSLYFGTGWLSGFLIDCDPDQWLAVAGLLSQYWIYTACTISFLVWDWRRFINEAQLPLLCFHTLAISWPVNVLSVSSHTCLLNNDPGVKSCTNKELSPLPLNTFQDFVCLITRKLILELLFGLILGAVLGKLLVNIERALNEILQGSLARPKNLLNFHQRAFGIVWCRLMHDSPGTF